MSNWKDVETQLRADLKVSRVQVLVAKNFILDRMHNAKKTIERFTSEVLTDFLISQSAQQPSPVVLHPSVPLESQIDAVLHAFSWKLAFGEAFWELINAGVLLWRRDRWLNIQLRQKWTTIIAGSSGVEGEWNLQDLQIACPNDVVLAPSRAIARQDVLADGDLYLQFLSIPNLHPATADYLQQAIKCFRNELYLPAVAMLGSASEVAWTALGESLVGYVDTLGLTSDISKAKRDDLTDKLLGMGKRIPLIVEIYQQNYKSYFEPLGKSSGIKPVELRAASTWADNVRDARNALHPSDTDRLAATYETVSMLLLATPTHLGAVYKLIDTANNPQAP